MQVTCENLRRQLNSRTELLSRIAVTRYRYDEAEMMVQDQSLVPADLRDMGRDVPSRPATVLGTRQGATEQQQQQQQARRDARERAQPTKLDLFRSCSDVEAAAVDLEADIPPGLDDDAVES
jgi:hypothetical protein